jgi:hypothetical protein
MARVIRDERVVNVYRRASKGRAAGYRDERVVRWLVVGNDGAVLTETTKRRVALSEARFFSAQERRAESS